MKEDFEKALEQAFEAGRRTMRMPIVGTGQWYDEYTFENFSEFYNTVKSALPQYLVSGSYAVVRWYDNANNDVICINEEVAKEYVDKYNKLAGADFCYVDKEIYKPMKEA